MKFFLLGFTAIYFLVAIFIVEVEPVPTEGLGPTPTPTPKIEFLGPPVRK